MVKHLNNIVLRYFCAVLSAFVCLSCTESLSEKFPSRKMMVSPVLSNLNISAVVQDSYGYIWIGTARGLNRFNGYEYVQYFRQPEDSCSLWNDNITALYVDSKNNLWVGDRQGVSRYDRERDVLIRYRATSEMLNVRKFVEDAQGNLYVGTFRGLGLIDKEKQCLTLLNGTVNSVADFTIDRSGVLWIVPADRNGICRFDTETRTLDAVPELNSYKCRTVVDMADGRMFVCADQGILVYDPVNNRVAALAAAEIGVDGLPDDIQQVFKTGEERSVCFMTESRKLFVWKGDDRVVEIPESEYGTPEDINCIYADKEGNLWIGTFDDGCKLVIKNKFPFCTDPVLSEQLHGRFITRVTSQGEDTLWVGTRYDDFYMYDKRNRTFRSYKLSSYFPQVEKKVTRIMYYDSKQRLWIGTENRLKCFRAGRDGLQQIEEFTTDGLLHRIYEDSSGNIWITSNGLYRLDAEECHASLRKMFPEGVRNANVTDIAELPSGDMIFSVFSEGLYVLHRGSESPQRLAVGEPPAKSALTYVGTLYVDTFGNLWVGTYGSGLLRYDQKNDFWRLYDVSDGLPSNDVVAISDDGRGDLWFGTAYGICRMNIESGVCSNYFETDGTLNNQYHERGEHKDSRGNMYFGGNYGLTFFNPADFVDNTFNVPRCIVESVEVRDGSVNSSTDRSPLKIPVTDVSRITLSYKDNPVSFEFAGIDYQAPNKLKYTYRLRGFDTEWSLPDGSRRANYSNLPAGSYLFEVKTVGENRQESPISSTLAVRVMPAPWYSWWAILLYVLSGGAVLFLMIRLLWNNRMNRIRLKIAEENLAKDAEMHDMKIRFFMNISHELKTPLSLIYGPLQRVLQVRRVPEEAQRYLSLIHVNVDRLMRLTNQLLDFSKLDSDTLTLRMERLDFPPLIGRVVGLFEDYARQKRIELGYTTEFQSLWMDADADKVEKIFSNLLSNAMKYTPAGGTVKVRLDQQMPESDSGLQRDVQYVHVAVQDNGIGVKEAELPYIFDRFKRFSTSSAGGNGIGLHYTKRLVEEHKGYISAELNADRGMTLHVYLPILSDSDCKIESVNFMTTGGLTDNERKMEVGLSYDLPVSDAADRPTLLIIDDEPGVQQFLQELLGTQYTLLSAFDGQQGLEIAQKELPTLILCDCLMPLMDGYEVCRRIKTLPVTCHIPVILLTAKSAVEDQIKGVQEGADVYIPKPFHPDYLLSVIRTTILNRRKIQKNIADHPQDLTLLNKQDQQFIERLHTLMEKGMSNPELNINVLATELNFSRTTFYRKVKALTGMAPNDYLKHYRLQRAAELILSGEYSISEVADMAGFCTHSYFSAMFKKEFGVLPREYQTVQTKRTI